MAASKLKTFVFVLYGALTFLLLCAVLVLIFKDDKTCSGIPPGMIEIHNRQAAHDLDSTGSNMQPKIENSPAKPDDSSAASAAGETPSAPVTASFAGKFELINSENFDEFLSEMGIGYFKRLAATRASSEYTITKNGDQWTLQTDSTFGTSKIVFVDGVPFNEDRLDGETVESVINIEGNVWKQLQKSDPPITIVRTFDDKGVVVVSTVNGVASIRTYKRKA